MAALEHIIQAARILKAQAGSPKQTLLAACREFWKSLVATDEWTDDLLERAERLADKLLAEGSIRTTIERMDTITSAEVAEDLFDLAAAIAGDVYRLPMTVVLAHFTTTTGERQ